MNVDKHSQQNPTLLLDLLPLDYFKKAVSCYLNIIFHWEGLQPPTRIYT